MTRDEFGVTHMASRDGLENSGVDSQSESFYSGTWLSPPSSELLPVGVATVTVTTGKLSRSRATESVT